MMDGSLGVEPSRRGFKGHASQPGRRQESGWWESNPQLEASDAPRLPTSSHPERLRHGTRTHSALGCSQRSDLPQRRWLPCRESNPTTPVSETGSCGQHPRHKCSSWESNPTAGAYQAPRPPRAFWSMPCQQGANPAYRRGAFADTGTGVQGFEPCPPG